MERFNKFTFTDKYKYKIGDDITLNYGEEKYKTKVVMCVPVNDLYEVTIELLDGYLELNDSCGVSTSYAKED